MKIIYNTWFPFGNYHTLNFFGILFTKRKQLPESTITHVNTHGSNEGDALAVLLPVVWGLSTYLSGCSTRNRTVHITILVLRKRLTINDENPDYLKTRKHYAWWKYIRLRSNHK